MSKTRCSAVNRALHELREDRREHAKPRNDKRLTEGKQTHLDMDFEKPKKPRRRASKK